MSIFSSCDAAPNSGVITYSETSTCGTDRCVALPDTRRLDDDEIVSGGLAVAIASGSAFEISLPASRVASERM